MPVVVHNGHGALVGLYVLAGHDLFPQQPVKQVKAVHRGFVPAADRGRGQAQPVLPVPVYLPVEWHVVKILVEYDGGQQCGSGHPFVDGRFGQRRRQDASVGTGTCDNFVAYDAAYIYAGGDALEAVGRFGTDLGIRLQNPAVGVGGAIRPQVGFNHLQGCCVESAAHRMTPAGGFCHIGRFRIPCMFPLRCTAWLLSRLLSGERQQQLCRIERQVALLAHTPVEALGPILNLPAQLYDLHLQILDAALELQAMAAFLPRLCGEGGRTPAGSL